MRVLVRYVAWSLTPINTPTEEVTMESRTEQVMRTLDWMERDITQAEKVAANATDAGAALAQVVYEFTEDPEGVGTDRLREAYGTFMGLYAGNFHA